MVVRTSKYEVIVVGGGPSGLSAAIVAGRAGVRTLIIERNEFLGGNGASGLPFLGFLDKHGRQVVGGIAQEFIDSLIQINGAYHHNRCPLHNSVTVVHPDLFKVVATEKSTGAGVDLLLHSEPVHVGVKNGKIKNITVLTKGTKIELEAEVVIDATGDGDVAYLGGATFGKGLQNGVMQPPSLLFTLGNFKKERFYDYLRQHPNDLLLPESMDVLYKYDVDFLKSNPSHVFLGLRESLEELRKRGTTSFPRDTLIYINSVNPGQVVVNSTRILNFDGTDPHDLTRGLIEAYSQVMEITEILKTHFPGFEDCFISGINPNIGVRETRRISGLKTLRLDDVINGRIPADSIALGAYKVDIHSGVDQTTILKEVEEPYGIPLGCLISKDIEGLMMSGRCISADSESLASARIMPVCMAVGEAAGVCAALAIREGKLPSQVEHEKVVRVLKENGAILTMNETRVV